MVMTHDSGYRIRRASDADSEAVCKLVFSVMEEFGLGTDPDGADADLKQVRSYYEKDGGWFELLQCNETLVGTVGMLPRADSQIELRKMYLLRSARGQGLGKALLAHAIDEARTRGFSEIVLETATVLETAIALYARFGFRRAGQEYAGCGKTACDQVWRLTLADYQPPPGNTVNLEVMT